MKEAIQPTIEDQQLKSEVKKKKLSKTDIDMINTEMIENKRGYKYSEDTDSIIKEIGELDMKLNNGEPEEEINGKTLEALEIEKEIAQTGDSGKREQLLEKMRNILESKRKESNGAIGELEQKEHGQQSFEEINNLINKIAGDYHSGRLEVKQFTDLTSPLRIQMSEAGYSGKQRNEAVKQLLEKLNIKDREIIDLTDEVMKDGEKKISLDALNGFDKLGIKKSDLENIEGFSGLSGGQQLLVLENLKQLNLGRIEEEAAVKYKKNTAESKFLGRIWKGISKKYQIAKLEKNKAEEIVKGGAAIHRETLQQLVNGMKEFGPEVEIKGGKLEIQYASGFKDLTPEQQKQVDEFNQVATEFSKIPYEWSLETANKKNREKSEDMKTRYEKAKANILKFKENEVGEKDACLYMNDVEMKVKLNQFLNSNPDVEKQLQNITDNKLWWRALTNIATERGIYAGAGFLSRTATISLIGFVGAPLAAAGMGGFLARKRGKETLRERNVLARKGIEDKSKEAKDFADAEYIHESIDFLINELEKKSLDADKKDEVIRSLKFHIEDAQNKIKDGTMNFGKNKDRLFNQYELAEKISEGAAQVEYNGINNKKYQKDIEIISEFLKKQDKKTSKAQKKYLRNQMIRGAIISAGFATAGYAIRHFGEELGWWGGHRGVVSSKIEESVKDKSKEVQSFKINKPAEPIADSPPYDPSGKTDPFNTEFKQKLEVAANQPEAAAAAEQEALNNIAAKVAEQEAAVKNIDIEIKGKIDTFSEAIYEAAKQADSKTQDNFIHKVLGAGVKLDDENRGKFLSQAARKLSIANIKTGDELDVKNLVHEGNTVRLKSDGSWDVLKGEGIEDAKIVSELQLRENWADAEGAKHGFNPDEVKFAGDSEHLDMRSFNTQIEGAEVTIDNQGNFSGEAGGKGFSGNISELAEGQTSKEVISEAMEEAKEAVADQTAEAAIIAPEEAIKTAKTGVEDIFGAKEDITQEKFQEIARLTGVNFKDGIDAGEKSKLQFLAEHQELFKTPEQAQYLFNNSEADFKLITDIKMNSGIGYGALAEKMAVSNLDIKNNIFYGKVLAGDEALSNMKKLLGGADVEKVSFGKNGRAIAELADGKEISILNNGQEGSIEIKKPFLQRQAVFEKKFNTNLSENGLSSVKEELGVEAEDIAEEPVVKAHDDLLEKYGVDRKNVIDLKKEIK
ncbi:hypothetical protein KKC83_03575 [Patescibacteria group bacterium]|nr:hypothetical protein [Candidatus Falkowbacteria bacterium]MBU3905487.1 hypothetical protein [Patescibacteria group bacterium]MBU4015128.1 hypothetical protein [Patescibacteria group bacterium]MBU4026594.1 hypothetical protein [Patescibacteria group bacterium]MBU4073493.1 hypothetical protein [Patescibacteria group bacterium]